METPAPSRPAAPAVVAVVVTRDPGPWLEQASQRLHKNKLAAALANNLARIAWSVLRHGKAFDTNRMEVTAV